MFCLTFRYRITNPAELQGKGLFFAQQIEARAE